MDDGLLGKGKVESHGIDEQEIGTEGQGRDSASHRQAGCFANVELLNLLHGGKRDTPSHCLLADCGGEEIAFFLGDDFAIPDAGDPAGNRQNHRPGRDGTKQAAATHFIHARDRL